ncbi:Vps51/Vps67-domain-containing protein [Lactifluus subvellereus]|nr:Vps51/Vps67-domain-containing protein [Lactifluus subvellereus]
MSSSDSPSPTPTSSTPPKPRPSNKASPSPLRPHSTPQPSGSQRPTTLPTVSPRLVGGSLASPATPPPERSKSRARDLLRKHYGLSVTPPPPSGRPMDPMDLDSPAFDAKAYYDQLITTASLPTLLKRENDLLKEMRELDGERQSLVYNNHHELIGATETISAMRHGAQSLDSDLELLKEAFSEISRLSAEIAIEDSTSSH